MNTCTGPAGCLTRARSSLLRLMLGRATHHRHLKGAATRICPPSDPAAGTPNRGEGPRTAPAATPRADHTADPRWAARAHDFGLNYMLPGVARPRPELVPRARELVPRPGTLFV